jgi:Tol biopolymer transport system component
VPILSGKRLGPYEILSSIGAGGMGEVYRAKDTRLDRIVAIKILPDHLADRAELRERFEREARTIASLNHPHICTLHDIGHQDGTDYLVMEYVEGETLAARLLKGPLPLDQVLRNAIEIADALDKAHRKGITHRDLKPSNIMLTKSGSKLLDFGLAKLREDAAPATPLSQLPTGKDPITAQGTILGTLQYMAPEQLEGKEADARTDIFAFGVVVYEMATGKKAFEGKSQASVISAIMSSDPQPMSSLQPMTPPALDRVVRTCLVKDPDERWQSASDLKRELKCIAESGSQVGIPAGAAQRKTSWQRLAWSLALTAALIAAIFAFYHFSKPAPEVPVLRSMILPPEGGTFIFNGPVGGAFLSPDGRNVAFIARAGKVTQLWVRPLDSFAARALPGTEDTSFAFWSPDNRNLGFFAQGKLKRIAVVGGPPQALCDTDSSRGASWGRTDVIIFARVSGEIQRIPASGGTPQRVTTLDVSRHEGTHRWPYFLPDGNHFLFMAALLGPVGEENVFYLGSLDGKRSRILFRGSSPIAYAVGHVVYLSDRVLMARAFNLDKLDFTGEAFPVAESVQFDSLFSNGIFSVSENGLLLYQQGQGSSAHSLLLFDRTGKQVGSLGESAPNSTPRFSPDGKNLVYDLISTDSGKLDLWMLDIGSGNRTRLASGDPLSLVSHSTVWSPDGRRLAYTSVKTGNRAIFIKAVNQIAQEEERWEAKDDAFFGAENWTPDGKFLILTERPIRTGARVALISVAGKDGAVALLEVQGANVDQGQVSSDGRWIAYRSDETGKFEIYISSFPKPTGKLQVSISGGVTPRWRHDGKELYYLAPDRKLMAVELKETSGSLQVASTRPLFELFQTMYVTGAGVNQYDVTQDGSRFAIDSVITDETSAPLNLVVNWTAGLKK